MMRVALRLTPVRTTSQMPRVVRPATNGLHHFTRRACDPRRSVTRRPFQSTRSRVHIVANAAPDQSGISVGQEVVGAAPETAAVGRNVSWVEETESFLQQVGQEVTHSWTRKEGLLDHLDFTLSTSRPNNWRRSAVHMLSAMAVVVLISTIAKEKAMQVSLAGVVCAGSWVWEIGRRFSPTFDRIVFSLFGKIGLAGCFHAEEMRKVTSWTWFTCSLLFLALACNPPAQVAALAALGWTDPVAGAPPPCIHLARHNRVPMLVTQVSAAPPAGEPLVSGCWGVGLCTVRSE